MRVAVGGVVDARSFTQIPCPPGLISDTGGNFANPDYWSAALWNRLMDNRVLSVGIEPAIVDDTSTYRVFAHCTLNSASAGNTTHALFPTSAGGVTVLVLNVHPTAPLSVASFGALSTGSGVSCVDVRLSRVCRANNLACGACARAGTSMSPPQPGKVKRWQYLQAARLCSTDMFSNTAPEAWSLSLIPRQCLWRNL